MISVKDAPLNPVGYEHIGTTTSAIGVTTATHATANVALIQAITADINWRDDGTDPTAAVSGGMLLAAGESFLYVGDLNAIKFINATAASGALVNVTSYK